MGHDFPESENYKVYLKKKVRSITLTPSSKNRGQLCKTLLLSLKYLQASSLLSAWNKLN